MAKARLFYLKRRSLKHLKFSLRYLKNLQVIESLSVRERSVYFDLKDSRKLRLQSDSYDSYMKEIRKEYSWKSS